MEPRVLRRAELMGGSRERVLLATIQGIETEYSIVERSTVNKLDSRVVYLIFDKEMADLEFTRFVSRNPEWAERSLVSR